MLAGVAGHFAHSRKETMDAKDIAQAQWVGSCQLQGVRWMGLAE
jgi:hypothetical protein